VLLELDAAASHVRGDATRLRQVVWNLLSNAIDHTPSGGEIRLRSRNLADGSLVIEVSDSGEGIDPADLGRIFSPFEQSAGGMRGGGGLGLGLSICRGIVDAHGGRISAYSDGLGKGTTLVVELPTVAAAKTRRATRPRGPSRNGQGRKILVVEDNMDNATALAELLQVHGYAVSVAGSVQDALNRAHEGFDVVVSDIGLPDGTGRDLIRALGRERPVKGIALSGYGADADVQRNAEAGFTRHLT
jgi:CheY-like chemotaxis protein